MQAKSPLAYLAFNICILYSGHLTLPYTQDRSVFIYLQHISSQTYRSLHPPPPAEFTGAFNWKNRSRTFPLLTYEPIPKPDRVSRVKSVQYRFRQESRGAADRRKNRQHQVKRVFVRTWAAYTSLALPRDQLHPLSGEGYNGFGGWGATLVDSLDVLWIMGLEHEFAEAVNATAHVDFTWTEDQTISVFETTIRYLGGLLAAYDLSGDGRLLYKATELGEMLYAAFDTENYMPINSWSIRKAADPSQKQTVGALHLASTGSLSLEFTRLSQLTGDMRFYDAIARISNAFEEQQNLTNLPGMWPASLKGATMDFHSGFEFSLGGVSDSMYEYLLKMDLLLGGSEQYTKMYNTAMDAAIEHLLFRPMLPHNVDILMAGKVHANPNTGIVLRPEVEHLGCFAGGMFALGGRVYDNGSHVDIGQKLALGCAWAYEAMPLGIMPEEFATVMCDDSTSCSWNHTHWVEVSGWRDVGKNVLPLGITYVKDKRYMLRPEAIESLFILYRITGDTTYQDIAWRMFESITHATETEIANAAIDNVLNTTAPLRDEMESFWLAETLKYFYLIFSEPDLISLDKYVFNTEAHPLRRPKRRGWTGWGGG